MPTPPLGNNISSFMTLAAKMYSMALLLVLALTLCELGASEVFVSSPPNSRHCPSDPVILSFITGGTYILCCMDGVQLKEGISISPIFSRDLQNITLTLTDDRPNASHTVVCSAWLNGQKYLSSPVSWSTEARPSAPANFSLECALEHGSVKCILTWEHPPNINDTSLLTYCLNITKQGAPVQEGCVKATQYSFAMSSMDWCGTYEVTSATKCNAVVSDTYRGTLTPVERGLLKDEITYDLNCTKDGQTQEVVICSVNHCNFLVQTDRGLQCSNGTPCVAFTVPSDVEYKVSVSSGGSRIPLNIRTFGVLEVVASLSPDGGNLTATCFFAPGSCATGCFLIMSNGVSMNGLMTYRVGGAFNAMASVPAQGLVLGLYRGMAYSTDSFGLLSGGGPSAAFSLNVSTHNQSPATRDSRLMCRAEGSFICCTCRLSSSCQYIVVSLKSGNIVEKTAGALSSAYCSQSLPPGNYSVFVICGSSKQGAILSDTILIPSPSGFTKTGIAAIVVPVIVLLIAAAAAAAAIIRYMKSNKKKGDQEMSGGGGLGQAVGVKPQRDGQLVLLDGGVLGVPLDGGVLHGVPLDGSVLGVPLDGSVHDVGEEGTDGANAGDKLCVDPCETNDRSSSTLPVVSEFNPSRASGKSSTQRTGPCASSSDLKRKDSNTLQSFNGAQSADTKKSTCIEMKPRTDAIQTGLQNGNDHMPLSNGVVVEPNADRKDTDYN